MPLIKPIVLNDGTTSITLNPNGRSGDTSNFVTTNAVSAATQATVKVYTSSNDDVARCEFKLTDPVVMLDANTGMSSVSENFIGRVLLRLPKMATTAQQDAFIAKMKSSFSDALVAAIYDGERIW